MKEIQNQDWATFKPLLEYKLCERRDFCFVHSCIPQALQQDQSVFVEGREYIVKIKELRRQMILVRFLTILQVPIPVGILQTLYHFIMSVSKIKTPRISAPCIPSLLHRVCSLMAFSITFLALNHFLRIWISWAIIFTFLALTLSSLTRWVLALTLQQNSKPGHIQLSR